MRSSPHQFIAALQIVHNLVTTRLERAAESADHIAHGNQDVFRLLAAPYSVHDLMIGNDMSAMGDEYRQHRIHQWREMHRFAIDNCMVAREIDLDPIITRERDDPA
jgi:hypothetical protein